MGGCKLNHGVDVYAILTYRDRHNDHLARYLSQPPGLWTRTSIQQQTILEYRQSKSKASLHRKPYPQLTRSYLSQPLQRTNPITTTAMTITRLEPPRCPKCYADGMRLKVGEHNPSGNAGRPYYKCYPCDRFICFADQRGISPANPLCQCGEYTRRQISGASKGVHHGIHYVCARGWCRFYEKHVDLDGAQRQVPARSVGICASYSYIWGLRLGFDGFILFFFSVWFVLSLRIMTYFFSPSIHV